MRFTEEEILRATNNFSDECKLGTGGFGSVFKGWIHGSVVALKKLTEVCYIAIIYHFILISLKDVAVAMAKKEGQKIPELFTVDGQLETEIKALTK